MVCTVELVYVESWVDVVWPYAKQYNIIKFKLIVNESASVQETIDRDIHTENYMNYESQIVLHNVRRKYYAYG